MSDQLNDEEDAMWSAVGGGAGGAGGGPQPCSRGKHSATLLGGHLYVLGGRGAGGALPLRDFWRYSLASGSWERLECRGAAPPALQEHSATAHEGRLYVFGGEPAPSGETPLWIYDTKTQVWRKLPGSPAPAARRRGAREPAGAGSSPRGRRGHSAHALRDCLLIYGGYKDLRGSTNELWAFHYESEWWQAVRTVSAGPARHRHAAALHDARLYVHAGQCDLRACHDLWHYDTISRVWSQVRLSSKLSPGPRAGHAAVRAGAHLYIFGGDAHHHASNDMWRFHFATETWERVPASAAGWPPARVDSVALLVPGAGGLRAGSAPGPAGAPPPPAPAHGLLRELSRLSAFHVRRAARCSYSVLAGDKDSTESLVRQEAALSKSHSAYVMDERRPGSPRAGDVPELAREPRSVPDFGDVALTPAQAARLSYLRADDDEDPPALTALAHTEPEDAELSTSDYASAERVNRAGAWLGFSNPHYLGPDVRALGQALTPDSGAGDIELQDLGRRRAPARADHQLHLLLVGGREPAHPALLQSPLSMWTYRLL